MNYEQWLNFIEELKINITSEKIKTIQNIEYNENIQGILEPKLINLVKEKFQNIISKIIKELPLIFSDINYLELNLINFKKQITQLLELIKIKQFSINNQTKLIEMIKTESNNIYDILMKESNKNDPTGIFSMTINNNKIKWSE